MTAENEWRQQKENKMSGEIHVKKSIICKARFKKNLTFNTNRLKANKRLLNGSFDKRSDVGG